MFLTPRQIATDIIRHPATIINTYITICDTYDTYNKKIDAYA